MRQNEGEKSAGNSNRKVKIYINNNLIKNIKADRSEKSKVNKDKEVSGNPNKNIFTNSTDEYDFIPNIGNYKYLTI